MASFHFFFKFCLLVFFFLPYFWQNPLHVSLSFLYFLFLFLSPKRFPFHSIGTREVVTQKNLSGLVPIRDLRLDPSLLCSIPLLALSPNLLIVWLFLSIAYLVTKLRCKWISLWKINKSQEKQKCQSMSSHRVPNWTEGMCQSVACQEIFHALQCDTLWFWTLNTCPVISPWRLIRLNSHSFQCLWHVLTMPCTVLFSCPGITCTKSLTFWCKAAYYLYISCALFPRERNSVWKEFVYLILFFKCTANLSFPFEEKWKW